MPLLLCQEHFSLFKYHKMIVVIRPLCYNLHIMTAEVPEDFKWWVPEEVIQPPIIDAIAPDAQWWVDEPEDTPLEQALSRDKEWWTLPQHKTLDTPSTDNSAIGNIDLGQYLPKPGEFADPKLTVPIPIEEAEHPELLGTYARDLAEGRIAGYELYDPKTQWTEKWTEMNQQDREAGNHVYFTATPLYLVKVFLSE